MRDTGTIELEQIFEKHYILRENDFGSAMASKMAGKPIERIISVIADLVALDMDEIPHQLLSQVKAENKVGLLVKTLQDRNIKVPKEIASALTDDSDLDISDDADDEQELEDLRPKAPKELDFSKPRFSAIPDEEEDDDEQSSVALDPSMR